MNFISSITRRRRSYPLLLPLSSSPGVVRGALSADRRTRNCRILSPLRWFPDARPQEWSYGALFEKELKLLIQKIDIKLMKPFNTTNHEDINPAQFKPKLVTCPSPYNCFCTTISVILTGSVEEAVAIQDWIQKIKEVVFPVDASSMRRIFPPSILTRHFSFPIDTRPIHGNLAWRYASISSSQLSGLCNERVRKDLITGVFI